MLKNILLHMLVLKIPSNINYVCVSWHFQNVTNNLQTRRKKIKRVAGGCKGSFCQ